jgi:hypothetical protein
MPVSFNRTPTGVKSPWRKLVLLTVCVAMAHALVLAGMPANANPPTDWAPDPQPLSLRVLARPVVPEQPMFAPAPSSPTKSAKTKRAATPIATPRVAPQNTAAIAALPSTAPENSAASLAAATPAVVPEVAKVSETTIVLAEAVASEPKPPSTRTTVPVTNIPRVQKLAYAPPVLLIYEGKGEARGFIKYAASGELLWAPDGSRYNAHLEISALGFRVRSWSSKGDLTDAGLQPLRFGDKPRGAELATHFQREKGIISFSANNPDVPLQAGAQDKLSAILQLSAIVAGEPERYGSGSHITFQAADAHRAELWKFRVGAIETLDLPGGMVTALKLSKEPTVDFDQRIEIWLAPDLRYLPVRIRITEANAEFADLLWRKSQKPD